MMNAIVCLAYPLQWSLPLLLLLLADDVIAASCVSLSVARLQALVS